MKNEKLKSVSEFIRVPGWLYAWELSVKKGRSNCAIIFSYINDLFENKDLLYLRIAGEWLFTDMNYLIKKSYEAFSYKVLYNALKQLAKEKLIELEIGKGFANIKINWIEYEKIKKEYTKEIKEEIHFQVYFFTLLYMTKMQLGLQAAFLMSRFIQEATTQGLKDNMSREFVWKYLFYSIGKEDQLTYMTRVLVNEELLMRKNIITCSATTLSGVGTLRHFEINVGEIKRWILAYDDIRTRSNLEEEKTEYNFELTKIETKKEEFVCDETF